VTTALSLFSGAGGMDVGFIQAGFKVVAANEIDAHACNTYRRNHPKSDLIEGCIEANTDKITKYKGVDIVFGGPPCQGFSVAGKMNPTDPRSKLVFSFADVVGLLKPRAFVMENVKALGKLSKFQPVRDELFKRMQKLGYSVSLVILNAKDFGVPQSRERTFIIGFLNSNISVNELDFSRYNKIAPTLREAIGHLGKAGTDGNPKITKAKITLAKNPVMRKSPYAGMLFNGQGRPLNPDAWSSTLPASMGGNRTPIIDEDHLYDGHSSWVEDYHNRITNNKVTPEFKEAPKRLRRLTIDEAAILQTFPNDYIFEGPQSKVFSQLGNAVPCELAHVVANVVNEKLRYLKEGSRKKMESSKQSPANA